MPSLPSVSLLAVLLGLLLGAPTASGESEAPPRIVAIGDIHGAYEELVGILRESGLVDADLRWTGGETVLVQLGDVTDRGTGVRQAMDLLMDLEEQASQAGGRVVVLLGNHEAMNLFGIVRDVTPEIFATFASDDAEARREAAYQEWLEVRRRQGEPAEPPGAAPGEGRRRWMEAFPLGYVEYMEAFGPDGRYGHWLRRLPTVVRIGDTAFLHGGLSAAVSAMSFEKINAAVRQEVLDFDEIRERLVELGLSLPHYDLSEIAAAVSRARERLERQELEGLSRAERRLWRDALDDFPELESTLSFGEDGPLWYRGYARLTEEEGEALSHELARTYRVERFVVAHSPPDPPGEIQVRFGGRVLLTDTGMLSGHYPGGRPAALEIAGDTFTAIYPGEREVLFVRQPAEPSPGRVWMGPDGNPLPFQTDEEAIEFLSSAKIIDRAPVSVGVTGSHRLFLEKDGVQARALFKTYHKIEDRSRLSDGGVVMFLRDTYLNEPAGFELSRLLGMDSVPPTVLRTVGREPGALQLWIEGAMMELERRDKGLSPPDESRWRRELAEMHVFDNLINNIDRNQGDMLFDIDWNLWLVDHSRAFGRERRLPKPEAVNRCSTRLYEALKALEEASLSEVLSPYMGRFEIRAVLARRDALIDLLDERIDTLGEERVLFSFDEPEPPAPVRFEVIDG